MSKESVRRSRRRLTGQRHRSATRGRRVVRYRLCGTSAKKRGDRQVYGSYVPLIPITGVSNLLGRAPGIRRRALRHRGRQGSRRELRPTIHSRVSVTGTIPIGNGGAKIRTCTPSNRRGTRTRRHNPSKIPISTIQATRRNRRVFRYKFNI